MLPVGSEPTTSASERPQTCTVDRAATESYLIHKHVPQHTIIRMINAVKVAPLVAREKHRLGMFDIRLLELRQRF